MIEDFSGRHIFIAVLAFAGSLVHTCSNKSVNEMDTIFNILLLLLLPRVPVKSCEETE